MKELNNFSTSIHTVLRDLIEAKSKRDNIKFTSYQLANALSMPRSIITKLTHADEAKRIINPKIETLLRIVEYFKADGFDITIDDLLGVKNRVVDVQAQRVPTDDELSSVVLYSLANPKKRLGTVEVKLPGASNKLSALYLEDSIEPIFKAGSVFFIDADKKPTDDTLVAVTVKGAAKVSIKKYYYKKKKIILRSLSAGEGDLVLMPTDSFRILGVVVRINAKT